MLALLHAASVAAASTAAKLGSLLSHLRRRLAQARAERERIEVDLFKGRYHLSSKSDDDLPLVN
jgi:hypothetical protein